MRLSLIGIDKLKALSYLTFAPFLHGSWDHEKDGSCEMTDLSQTLYDVEAENKWNFITPNCQLTRQVKTGKIMKSQTQEMREEKSEKLYSAWLNLDLVAIFSAYKYDCRNQFMW